MNLSLFKKTLICLTSYYFYCAGGFENHWHKPVDEKTAYNE